MEIIEINEHTCRFEDSGVRFFLLEGTKKALLIDSGMNTPEAAKIAASITELPVELLNTHADPDHISGNGGFSQFYMSPAEEENLRSHGNNGKIIPVSEGDIIDLGDRPLKIIDIPGHTPGSIAIIDVNNRALIAGDSVQNGNIFMFSERRNMKKYAESLKHLQKFTDQFDEIYPSHGTFPVYNEQITKLIQGAEEINAGKASGNQIEMFGNKVMLYKFDYAGFLCDLEAPEKDSTKQKILMAALDLFSERGFDGVGVDEIGETAGFKGPSLYRHFKGKDEILSELVRWGEKYYTEKFGNTSKDVKIPESTAELIKITKEKIDLTMHDSIICKFRKLFTIEQYRNPKLSALATLHSFENFTNLFSSMFDGMMKKKLIKYNNPEILALEYMAPVSLLLQVYDRDSSKEKEINQIIDQHLHHFITTYSFAV
ncbi:MAG: MBL fold metallo-hydrolase [Treponema sp.]|nr:MBL fold metallo-hydrolase [Treponema sp.]